MTDEKKRDKVGISETPNPDSEKSEVKAWLRTLTSTETWRDGIAEKSGWKRYVDEYKNEWGHLQKSVSIPIIPINLIYAYVKTEIARLYFRDPWITVNPKRVEDLGAAQIAEQIINYTWGELSLKNEIKLTLLESLLVGHSYIKVGYAAEFGTVESQPKEPVKRGPGRPPAKAKDIETSEFVKAEHVFAYHVPYKEVLFDPSAEFPAPHTARWMAHKIVKPLRAIKESGIYDHVDDLKPGSQQDDPNQPYETSDSSKEALAKDVKTATLYEIYDLDNMRIVTVSPGCPYFLNQIKYPEWLNGGFPFIQLAFNPVPGEVFPMSDVAAQEGLSIEMTKVIAMWINHLKRHSARQILIEPDLFSEQEESKFKDAIDGAVIHANGPIADKYFLPQYPAIQADAYQIYNEVYKIYQVVAGQTPADQGGQARVPTRTLGELRLQLMGGHARAEEKVDVLEDFIEEVARKLLGIMQKKYDLPKIARIVGPKSVQEKIVGMLPKRPTAQPQLPNGQANPLFAQQFTTEFSFSWNRQDILGDMDVGVVAGSTVPMDRESQLQILEKLIPLLPAAGVVPGSPAARAYAREVFRLVGIQSIEAIMDLAEQTPPQPPPKVLETQAKIQAKQAETAMKIQGKMAEEKIKLEAMRQKLDVDKQKANLDLHKNVINSILQGVRATQATPQENGNGF